MRDNYNRLYELYDLINELRRHEFSGMTIEDISERFGWERRTVERMLTVVETLMGGAFRRELMDDGSRRKLYRISNPDISKLPPDFIQPDEIVSLRNAIGAIKNNRDLAMNLETLAGKLENINKYAKGDIEDMIITSGIAAMPRPKIKCDAKLLGDLQNAILGCSQVEIEYKDKKSVTCPLGLLYGRANNYLVAANEKYIKNPIKYILSDIKSVRVLDKSFDAQGFNIKDFATRSFGVFTENEHGYDIEWRVDKSAAADAMRYIFHPNQEITKNRDGSLTIKFHSCGLLEMAWHLVTWGGTIVPVTPVELVKTYKEVLTKATNSLEQKKDKK